MSEDVNKTAERDALVLLTQDEADNPVSAMKNLARIMQQGIRFQNSSNKNFQ